MRFRVSELSKEKVREHLKKGPTTLPSLWNPINIEIKSRLKVGFASTLSDGVVTIHKVERQETDGKLATRPVAQYLMRGLRPGEYEVPIHTSFLKERAHAMLNDLNREAGNDSESSSQVSQGVHA